MSTKKITYSSVLIAFGILLPYIFHISFAGPTAASFLNPIHYAAFFAAGFFGPITGGVVGALTILLSRLLTGGMPPSPMYIFMLFEVITYGLIFGYLYNKKRLNILVSLIIAMLIGRIVFILASYFIGSLIMNEGFAIVTTLLSLSKGLVGAAIQLAIIPVIVDRINKTFGFNLEEEDKLIIE